MERLVRVMPAGRNHDHDQPKIHLPRSADSRCPAPDHPQADALGHFVRSARLLAVAVTLTVVALVGGSGAQSATAQTISNQFGSMKTSKVTGETDHGGTFVGKYKVRNFVVRNDNVTAVGRLTGTLTKKSGATRDVAGRVRMPLNMAASQARNTTAALPTASTTATPSVVSCEILNLVLGPIDLDVLGLVIHLDRVVLHVTAVPGAGNLLGNLLCAVVGLLDGTGIAGLSGILTNILNAILGILQA
jgi:hypothetical protein